MIFCDRCGTDGGVKKYAYIIAGVNHSGKSPPLHIIYSELCDTCYESVAGSLAEFAAKQKTWVNRRKKKGHRKPTEDAGPANDLSGSPEAPSSGPDHDPGESSPSQQGSTNPHASVGE